MKISSIIRNRFVTTFFSGAVLLAIWLLISGIVGNKLLLPGPIETFWRLIQLFLSGQILLPLFETTAKALIGLFLSLGVALVLGFFMGLNRFIYSLFEPGIIVIQSVPIISWLALALLWWGIGFSSPIYIVFLTLFPILTINVTEGVRNVDGKLVEMSRAFSISGKTVLKDIYFASAFPFILSAMKVGVSFMWKSVAIAEFMVGTSGIGRKISDSKYSLETTDVFAFTILLVILGIISEKILDLATKEAGKYVVKA